MANRLPMITRHTLWEEGPMICATDQPFVLAVKAVGAGTVQHVRWIYAAKLDMLPLRGAHHALQRHAQQFDRRVCHQQRPVLWHCAAYQWVGRWRRWGRGQWWGDGLVGAGGLAG